MLPGAPSGPQAGNGAAAPAADEPSEPAFDLTESLGYVDGDRELLDEMIELFFAQADQLLPQIRDAGERRDLQTLAQQAHKLAGSMVGFGAKAAVASARRLEAASREARAELIAASLDELVREVTRLREALAAYVRSSGRHYRLSGPPSQNSGDPKVVRS